MDFEIILQILVLEKSFIDLLRFKIGPPIFPWWVPVRNFAPKTHFGVIGTYRKPVTSSTTFKKSGVLDFPELKS